MYLTYNANQKELFLQYIVTGNDKLRQNYFARQARLSTGYSTMTLPTGSISCPVISMSLDDLRRIWLANNFMMLK
jgi:hypothetical protein